MPSPGNQSAQTHGHHQRWESGWRANSSCESSGSSQPSAASAKRSSIHRRSSHPKRSMTNQSQAIWNHRPHQPGLQPTNKFVRPRQPAMTNPGRATEFGMQCSYHATIQSERWKSLQRSRCQTALEISTIPQQPHERWAIRKSRQKSKTRRQRLSDGMIGSWS